MCKNKEKKTSKRQENTTSLIEKWAIWIIGVCILLLLFGVGCFVFNKTILTPKVARLEIRIVPDSLFEDATYSKREIDSLINVTKTTLKSYEHHFQTETVQKEQEDNYKSFGALLLSVIVGLGGFFGFKSFKDIKDRGEQTAKEVASAKASEIAEKEAEKAAEKYLAKKLPEVVQKQFEDSFGETTVNSIKDSIKADLLPQIIQLIQNMSDKNGEEGQSEGTRSGAQTEEPMSPEEMFNQSNKNE